MFNRRELYILTLIMVAISVPSSASRAQSGVGDNSIAPATSNPVAVSEEPQTQDALQSATTSVPQEKEQQQTLATVQDSTASAATIDVQPQDVGKKVAEINERMALLSAQLAELELKAKIATKVSEIADIAKKDKPDKKKENLNSLDMGGSFQTPTPNFGSRAMPQMPFSRVGSGMPVVKSVEGVDGHLKASIEVKGEGVRTVHVGDKVAGWTVQDIRVDAVTVQKGKTVQELYFGSGAKESDNLSVGNSMGMSSGFAGGLSPAMNIEPLTYKE